MFAGQVIAGRACTVTVKLHVSVIAPITAVQVTRVTPSGKLAPDAGVHEKLAISGATAGAGYVTTAVVAPALAQTDWFGGQVIRGGGITVTVKLHETGPQSLRAVQVTVVVPTAKLDPEAGVHVTAVPAGVTDGAA